jgi:hypothetical protein
MLGWYAAAAVVVVLGVILIAANRASPEAPVVGDHWHAAFGVNVCGTWLEPAPEFHTAVGSTQSAGIHSHGDGLIHLHPYVTSETGAKATVGQFLEYGGWEADADSFRAWDQVEHATGDECDGQEADVRWSLNGEERSDDISDYQPRDGDIIALALLPPGEDIGEPPSAREDLGSPSDVSVPGATVPPATVPGDPSGTSPGGDAGGDQPGTGTTATTLAP